jgi:hypothetical protein
MSRSINTVHYDLINIIDEENQRESLLEDKNYEQYVHFGVTVSIYSTTLVILYVQIDDSLMCKTQGHNDENRQYYT